MPFQCKARRGISIDPSHTQADCNYALMSKPAKPCWLRQHCLMLTLRKQPFFTGTNFQVRANHVCLSFKAWPNAAMLTYPAASGPASEPQCLHPQSSVTCPAKDLNGEGTQQQACKRPSPCARAQISQLLLLLKGMMWCIPMTVPRMQPRIHVLRQGSLP